MFQHILSSQQQNLAVKDLVLSHGLSVSNLEICDDVISDHMPVLFEVVFPCAVVKSGAPVRR